MEQKYNLRMIFFALVLVSPTLFANNAISSEPVVKKIEIESNSFTSATDSGWSYTCKDGIEVDLMSLGLKNNVPASIDLSNTEGIDRVVVEVVYKGQNPGSSVEIEDGSGQKYTANRVAPTGGSSDVWYYRAELPATSAVVYNNTTKEAYAQSMLVYVFTYRNNGISSSGVFTSLNGYNDIQTTSIPIPTDSGPRTVAVELPISELTADGRYIKIEVSAGANNSVELIEKINSFPSGTCCIKTFELKLDEVPGDVDEITITIDTRNKKNGQSVNGQSWILAGAVKTDVRCTCVDFDTTPPVAVNFYDHVLLEDASQLPIVNFTDDCSAVTVEYNEYSDIVESCKIGYSPMDEYKDSNLWFYNFPFDKQHHWEDGYVEKFDDGTVKIHGRAINNEDPTSGWLIEIYFKSLVDYATWQSTGDYQPTDAKKEQRAYANVDFSKPYKFIGFGAYKDATINLLSNTNLHHMEIGPKDTYGNYGVGFSISYEGTVNGQAIGGEGAQHLEMNASLNNCAVKRVHIIVREWTVTDAAGNAKVYVQRVEFE
ncbi:hypothetical protein MWU59_13635 [Flavobacteriaceae bacterium F08102]|nr:hypothetical protein [Flavobacteriaceae bacterium F08102]